jgi:glycosyltransferase involved in cell wall biosynthesis
MERFAAGGPWALGIGRPSALALAALCELGCTASFLDAMDNFPEFHRGLSRRAMRRHEDAVAQRVDLVMASSTFLANKFARRGLHVEKVLNAGETRQLGTGVTFPIHQSPVLGYLGCLGHWFDWPLVARLAQAMPEVKIELVGPCVIGPPRHLPPNIRLLPPCKQSEVAGHLARFSAGLIPFRNNALTAGVDPIKFYEYRAAGLPVLSTSFGEMSLRGRDDGVYFLDRASDFATVVSIALGHRYDAAETRRFQEENDWASRFGRRTCFGWSLPASRMRRAA